MLEFLLNVNEQVLLITITDKNFVIYRQLKTAKIINYYSYKIYFIMPLVV